VLAGFAKKKISFMLNADVAPTTIKVEVPEQTPIQILPSAKKESIN
jgi:hypothetical protein